MTLMCRYCKKPSLKFTGLGIQKIEMELYKLFPELTIIRLDSDSIKTPKALENALKHFEEKGEQLTAFAALNYAHGWLDAGARLGLFDVDGDNELFTVDETWKK